VIGDSWTAKRAPRSGIGDSWSAKRVKNARCKSLF